MTRKRTQIQFITDYLSKRQRHDQIRKVSPLNHPRFITNSPNVNSQQKKKKRDKEKKEKRKR